MASHTRNVAGHKLTKIANSMYRQDCGSGKSRLFIRFGTSKKFHWRYTSAFKRNKVSDKLSTKHYPTLTAAVIAVNTN